MATCRRSSAPVTPQAAQESAFYGCGSVAVVVPTPRDSPGRELRPRRFTTYATSSASTKDCPANPTSAGVVGPAPPSLSTPSPKNDECHIDELHGHAVRSSGHLPSEHFEGTDVPVRSLRRPTVRCGPGHRRLAIVGRGPRNARRGRRDASEGRHGSMRPRSGCSTADGRRRATNSALSSGHRSRRETTVYVTPGPPAAAPAALTASGTVHGVPHRGTSDTSTESPGRRGRPAPWLRYNRRHRLPRHRLRLVPPTPAILPAKLRDRTFKIRVATTAAWQPSTVRSRESLRSSADQPQGGRCPPLAARSRSKCLPTGKVCSADGVPPDLPPSRP